MNKHYLKLIAIVLAIVSIPVGIAYRNTLKKIAMKAVSWLKEAK